MVRGCASGKYRTRKGASFPFLQQLRGRTNGMSRTFDRTERMQHRAVKLTPRQIQTSSILIFIAIPSDQIRLDWWAVHSTSVLDIPRTMPSNAVGSRLVGLYHQQRHRTSIMPIAQRLVDAVSVPTLGPPDDRLEASAFLRPHSKSRLGRSKTRKCTVGYVGQRESSKDRLVGSVPSGILRLFF